jgi:cytochrome b6-f complex iron-sulfur subunit
MANAAVGADAKSGGITRREFLYYIWGASMAIYAAQFSGLLIWFLLPRFREGEFGGKFVLPIGDLPGINEPPANVPEGLFWLVNMDTEQSNSLMYQAEDEAAPIKGVAAIYKVCTHLGCIYTWTEANDRYECPCHGSKYRLDGRRIEAPAPRDLDRFAVEALDADQNPIPGAISEIVMENGVEVFAPLELPPEAAFISIDTGNRKLGSASTLLENFSDSP